MISLKEYKIVFSKKSKAADTKWKFEAFRQEKKYITNFIIKFKVLAIKVKIDNICIIFLLKKNIRSNIIKTILEYLSIVVPESLKKQKQKLSIEEEKHLWTLESPKTTTTKMESPDALITIFMNI